MILNSPDLDHHAFFSNIFYSRYNSKKFLLRINYLEAILKVGHAILNTKLNKAFIFNILNWEVGPQPTNLVDL